MQISIKEFKKLIIETIEQETGIRFVETPDYSDEETETATAAAHDIGSFMPGFVKVPGHGWHFCAIQNGNPTHWWTEENGWMEVPEDATFKISPKLMGPRKARGYARGEHNET